MRKLMPPVVILLALVPQLYSQPVCPSDFAGDPKARGCLDPRRLPPPSAESGECHLTFSIDESSVLILRDRHVLYEVERGAPPVLSANASECKGSLPSTGVEVAVDKVSGRGSVTPVAATDGSFRFRVVDPDRGAGSYQVRVVWQRAAQGVAVSQPVAAPAETERVNPADGQNYIYVPGGVFEMGCAPTDGDCASDEKPSHTVRLSPFWIGETETTVGAFLKVMGRTPANSGGLIDPVVNVTWVEADGFCHQAGGRLPTEAEFEYAARSGHTTLAQVTLPDIAWFQDNARGLQSSGTRNPNEFRLYDMLGNAMEWTGDWYSADYYKSSPASDPAGPNRGTERVNRGGSFDKSRNSLRFSARDKNQPTRRYPNLGFRCVWMPPAR